MLKVSRVIGLMVWFLIAVSSSPVSAKCVGKFVNPITDICWKCIFPITIAGVTVQAGQEEDNETSRQPLCFCGDPPRVGIPISFWEPVRLVDVTRTPFCMTNMGGTKLGGPSVKGHGSIDHAKDGKMKNSFYQVHWYLYPLIYWLELLTDFVCIEKGGFDLAYMTELDPFWNDDEMSFILNPEAAIFGNPIAQAACAGDCVKASTGFGFDSLFWCAGCQGCLYPFTGTVGAHSSGIQASLLLTQRFMAKLHREGLLWGYIGDQGLCSKYPMPIIKKSQYKIQMVYPLSNGRCDALGRTDVLWSSGKQFPVDGEDFGYLIWRKRQCCLL